MLDYVNKSTLFHTLLQKLQTFTILSENRNRRSQSDTFYEKVVEEEIKRFK